MRNAVLKKLHMTEILRSCRVLLPMKFEPVVDRNTAKALDLAISCDFLSHVDGAFDERRSVCLWHGTCALGGIAPIASLLGFQSRGTHDG
jgi:hypothetical protein